MPHIRALAGQSRIVALRNRPVPATDQAQEKFYIEDGWVFREHHGKYVECICRSDDISVLPAHIGPVAQAF